MDIHQLYLSAYSICQRADRERKEYIGFRKDKRQGFKLIVSSDSNNGASSYRSGLMVPDWASNVLYRLRELGFVDNPVEDLDRYFSELNNVGYDIPDDEPDFINCPDCGVRIPNDRNCWYCENRPDGI